LLTGKRVKNNPNTTMRRELSQKGGGNRISKGEGVGGQSIERGTGLKEECRYR